MLDSERLGVGRWERENAVGEFPGGLMVRILGFSCCGLGSSPGQETEIPQAVGSMGEGEGKRWLGRKNAGRWPS